MQWINFISFVCLCYSVLKVGTVQYSNRWSVQIEGGKDEADRLATKHGFINEGKVGRYLAECWSFEIVVVTVYVFFYFDHKNTRKNRLRLLCKSR